MDQSEIKNKNNDEKWQDENLPWKSWGSWFSWGSPVGTGIFLCSVGIFLLLLHLAGIIR